jgi:large subunit ribosomal protein L28
MSRVCELTGAKANNGMAVSHSHIRTKKLQQVNLQKRRLWWQEGKKWVNIKISTKALKSIQKIGLDKVAKTNGVDTKNNKKNNKKKDMYMDVIYIKYK